MDLDKAKREVAAFRDYTHPKDLARKEFDLREAQRQLDRAKAKANGIILVKFRRIEGTWYWN